MTEYIQIERRYRRVSILTGVCIVLFWSVMTSFLVYKKIRKYRDENTIDYSLLFREERIRTFSYMDIYLGDKLLGFTKTNISETEEGGRIIHGETLIRLSVIPEGFSMISSIRISPEREFEQFVFTVKSPFESRVEGKRRGEKIIIECPELQYREVMDFPGGLISSGISPFSDVGSLKKGREWQVGAFDPVTRTVRKVRIRVVSEQKIKWKELEKSVFVLECTDQSGSRLATALVDSSGTVLRETIDIFGMKLRLERRD